MAVRGKADKREVELARELKDARAQQAATAAILKVIARSPSDALPVFEAIVKNAHRLVGAAYSILYGFDGKMLSVLADRQSSAKASAALRGMYPSPAQRSHFIGRAVLEGREMHTTDIRVDARFPANRNAHAKALAYRAALVVPLEQDGKVIGAVATGRRDARPFGRHEIQLLRAFADQAVIAIENAHLFNETKESLERQTATAEILRVISRSQTETRSVFEAIADSTMSLFDAWSTAVFSFDRDNLHLEAARGALPDSEQYLREQYPRQPNVEFSLADRCVLENIEFQIADVWSDPNPVYSNRARARGYRSLLAVPMLRNGVSIGAIAVSRKESGGFSAPETELLKTFADQAVIAIENVRLFNETKEALDRQTATAEILEVISSSPTDTQPVFDAIVKSALKLIGGLSALMNRVEGDTLVLGALTSVDSTSDGPTLKAYPRPVSGSYMTERVMRTRAHFAIEDAESDAGIAPELKEMARTRGWRSCLCVPMLRDGITIGTIFVTRREAGKFPDKEVGLLSTFASQAVIAIENVRMFNETRALEQERLARLKGFFSPQLGELLATGKGEDLLKTHRREITVQFFDLRGFTAFTGSAEPEEVMELLREFHGALGKLVMEHEGTIERFGGDSVMVFFNDPLPVERPAEQAVQSALAMMLAFDPIAARWKKRGHDLGLGAGIAQGYATLGAIGFEGRRDYAAIGPVTNLAARLCAEAKGGQILTDLKTSAALDGAFQFDALEPLSLKGFAQPVPAFALRRA